MSIIGVGATGSNIALLAAKMGFTHFKIWDPDIVESHNLPNQTYDSEHVGQPKVAALTEVLKRFNPGIKVESIQDYFTTENHKKDLEGILIVTVDTMSARKDILESMKFNWRLKAIFETRLGFSHGEAWYLHPMDLEKIELWESTLKNDDEIDDGPCNMQMCSTLVYPVVGYVVHMACKILSAEEKQEVWTPLMRKTFMLEDDLQVFNK